MTGRKTSHDSCDRAVQLPEAKSCKLLTSSSGLLVPGETASATSWTVTLNNYNHNLKSNHVQLAACAPQRQRHTMKAYISKITSNVEEAEKPCQCVHLLAAHIRDNVMKNVQASGRNLCSLTLRKVDKHNGSDTGSHSCDVTTPRAGNVYIKSAENVYITKQLIDVQIRTEQDMGSASDQTGGSVMSQVEKVVMSQQRITINVNVGDCPERVQHVLIEQITDPKLLHAVGKILVAKTTWRPTSLKEQGHICEAAAHTGDEFTRERGKQELLREENERKAHLIRHHQKERRELEVKVVSFVLKVQEAHDQLVSGLLQQMEAGKLSDVVRRLFTEFNVRLMAVDCGLGFLMDVPMAQWEEAKSKQQQIQEMLSGLVPGQRWEEVQWSDMQISKPHLDTEGKVVELQLGQPLPLQDLSLQEGEEHALAANMPFWLNFVRSQFPERHTRTYTLPSSSAEGIVSTGSDFISKSPRQRVLFSLQEMAAAQQEAMVILGPLRFGQHCAEPPYAAAVAQRSPDSRLSEVAATSIEEAARDHFELLLISRSHGLVVCQMKTVGDNFRRKNYTEQFADILVRKVLNLAVQQLKKAEDSLRRVVCHYLPGVVIRKTIGLPFVTSHVFVRAVSGDQTLLKDLGQCLGTNTSPTDIADLCLFSDQLSTRESLNKTNSEVFKPLKEWWVRRVAANGPDPALTSERYDLLLARFCGPFMSAVLPCIFEPRLSLAVPEADDGEKCARITLTRQQLNLLHAAPPRLYVSGPPGTGKTVVLLLAAMEWLNGGHDVAVMVTWRQSRAASYLLHHLLQLYARSRSTAGDNVGKVSVEDVHTENKTHLRATTERLKTQISLRDNLFLVADEEGPDTNHSFQDLCQNLLAQIPDLHLWAASSECSSTPAGWQLVYLTEPLRCKLQTALEAFQTPENLGGKVTAMPTWQPNNTLFHCGNNHWKPSIQDCVQCGRELAFCLRRLGVGLSDRDVHDSVSGRRKACLSSSGHLRFKDVFILFHDTFANNCGMLTGLRNCQIPVKVIDERSVTDIQDVALGGSDVVRVGHLDAVRGLERRVIVFVANGNGETWFQRLRAQSRCTEYLVYVYQP